MRTQLNIGRTARLLISRFGDDGGEVARQRSRFCFLRHEEAAAAEWQLVSAKIDEFLRARPMGRPH